MRKILNLTGALFIGASVLSSPASAQTLPCFADITFTPGHSDIVLVLTKNNRRIPIYQLDAADLNDAQTNIRLWVGGGYIDFGNCTGLPNVLAKIEDFMGLVREHSSFQ